MTVTRRVRRGRETYEAAVKVDGVMTSRSFSTEERANAWHARELARAREQRATAKASTAVHTVASWSAHWLDVSRGSLAPASHRSYRATVCTHVLTKDRDLADVALTELRASDLTGLYAEVAKTRAHSTVRQVHKVLRQLLKAAVAERLIITNPADDAKLPRRSGELAEVQAWSPRQMLAFLTDERVRSSPIYPVIVVAAATGMRRGEVLGVTERDLRLSGAEPELRVRRSLHQDGSTDAPKSRRGRRTLPLSPPAVAALRQALATRPPGGAPRVFLRPDGGPLSLNAVSKAFQVLADRFVASAAGRAVGAERLTFHGLRHSWVSNQLAAGSPPALVSKLAGHASVSFTIDHYGHVTAEAAHGLRSLYVVPDAAEPDDVQEVA